MCDRHRNLKHLGMTFYGIISFIIWQFDPDPEGSIISVSYVKELQTKLWTTLVFEATSTSLHGSY